jgi:hypothetical protein
MNTTSSLTFRKIAHAIYEARVDNGTARYMVIGIDHGGPRGGSTRTWRLTFPRAIRPSADFPNRQAAEHAANEYEAGAGA